MTIRVLMFCAFATLFGVAAAQAQTVQFDNGASQFAESGASVSINNFTIANQPNRYLVIATGHAQNNTVINSLTWNGSEALTSLGQITSNNNIRMSIWGLKNPTATTGTITVTYSAQLVEPAVLLAASFYNVDQTSPTVGSVASAQGASGNTVSLDPNGVANGVVVGSAWRTTWDNAMPSITDGSNMTRIASNNTNGWLSTVLSYRNTTAAGTANLNWTFSGGTTYAVAGLGIGLRPAAGAVNQNPVANNDSVTTAYNTATTVSVLANDTDPESNTLSVTSASNPPNGSAVVNADNTITYTPDANYSGADSFTYTISDGNGGTATGTVNVTVNGGPRTLTYTYDALGRLSMVTPSSGNAVCYSYDAADNRTVVTTSGCSPPPPPPPPPTISLAGGNVIDSGPGPANRFATIAFSANGAITGTRYGSPTVPLSGAWVSPAPPSNPGAYQIRATTGQTGLGGSQVGSWLSLSSTRSWTVARTIPGTFAATLTIEIRRASDSVVLASGSYFISATRTP